MYVSKVLEFHNVDEDDDDVVVLSSDNCFYCSNNSSPVVVAWPIYDTIDDDDDDTFCTCMIGRVLAMSSHGTKGKKKTRATSGGPTVRHHPLVVFGYHVATTTVCVQYYYESARAPIGCEFLVESVHIL
eukprot:scaffold2647_cov75-Cylindrotheca_fusiformis.AAC.2